MNSSNSFFIMNPPNREQSARVKNSQPKNEKISLFIHDKYAAKYTADQLDLILRKSKSSGQQSALTIWILFILFVIFVDFLRLNTFVTSRETYRVEGIVDGGMISNFSNSKFGWPIFLLAIGSISALLIEGITSDNYLFVAASAATLLLLEIGTIITCLALNTNSTSQGSSLRWDLFGNLNLAVGCTMCLAWIIWHSIELILLIHTTKRVHDVIDMNQDKTLLSRRRYKALDNSRKKTKSSSNRKDKVKRGPALKIVKSKSALLNATSSKKSLHKSAPAAVPSPKLIKSRLTLSKKSLPEAKASETSLPDSSASKKSAKEIPASKISLNLIHPSKRSSFSLVKKDENR